MEKEKIQLGDEVLDTITGFKGIAVCRSTWIHGCNRITVQPKVIKGELKESQTFDEPQLRLLKSKKVVRKTETGGWKPEIGLKINPSRR